MSAHDDGPGRRAGQSPGFESESARRQSAVSAPGGQAWGGGAPNTQKNEVPFMVQGAGRPGQPNIFGNGGPTFTQMPTYTPVTRGPQQQPQAPEPAYQQPAPPAQQPPQARPAAPSHPAPKAPPAPQAPAYQPHQPQPQSYGNQSYQPQAYPAPGQNSGAPSHGYSPQDLPDLSNADPGFPDSIFPDFSASTSADASFSDSSYSTDADYGHDDALMADSAYAAPEEPHYDPQPHMPQAQPAYQPQAPQPQVPSRDPGRQLQAFDAVYDQPPQIALGGGHQPPAHVPQDFYEADRGDADFLDESQVIAPPAGKLASTLKGRSAFMIGSALLGAIALGGAIAYAYKLSGGGLDGETPIVTADARPVKEVPDQPGGKEFPHKNKLIYDRLTNTDQPESERLVPRQEDVAVPALPPSAATAGLPAPVATTDLMNPATTQAVDGAEEEGGPRKVKTLRVLPDGSVEAAPPAEMAEAAADATAAGAAVPAEAPAAMMPVPAAEAMQQATAPAQAAPEAPQQVAAADPAAAAAPEPAADTKYVVQVGSKKSQTDALASFADIQQKYPTLLTNYRPIVRKADLGSKGVWYRLQLGPIEDKAAAYKLCGDLKSQGLPDCLVMTQ